MLTHRKEWVPMFMNAKHMVDEGFPLSQDHIPRFFKDNKRPVSLAQSERIQFSESNLYNLRQKHYRAFLPQEHIDSKFALPVTFYL